MKATDLMLNDLVLYRGEVAKVIGITANGEVSLLVDGHIVARFVYAEGLSPIPLTSEILEKNGFVEDNAFEDCLQYEIFGIDSLLCGLSYGEEIDTWTFETFKFWTDVDIDGAPIDWGYSSKTNIPNIRFVHELQLALKLCRIEKEITL